MVLNDIRKLAVRRQIRVRFRLADGSECVVNEHGVGKVPSLAAPPAYNLEEEFAQAVQFSIEETGGRRKSLARHELEQMAVSGPAETPHVHDHDE